MTTLSLLAGRIVGVQICRVNMELFFSLPGKGKPLDTDSGAITNSTEDENLVEMGKPRLGDITKMKIYIKESQEFKVTLLIINPSRAKNQWCIYIDISNCNGVKNV